MKEQLAQVNRTVVALVLVLVVGAGGFIWWQFMYKPAVAARDSAQMTASAAQATLSDAQGRLATAQQQVDEAKKADGGKLDESIARLQLTQEAITPKAHIDDAAVVLSKFADQSGISTQLAMTVPDDAASTAGSAATPVNIELKAAGSYLELQHFISLVEGSVEVKRGALHVRGRLFNVVSIAMTPPDVSGATTGSDSSGSEDSPNELKVSKGDIMYDIKIRMYLSAFGGDASATATTPGATGTPGATDGTATGATGTPGATDATGATPGATGTTGATAGTAGATNSTATAGTTTGTTPGTVSPTGTTSPTGTATPTAGATG